MRVKHDLLAFWDQRVREYRDTGYSDRILYKYDQPLRLRAIRKVMNRVQGSMEQRRILDVGCGVGDFCLMFAKMGAEVTGIDINQEVILKAKKRAEEEEVQCNFSVTWVDEMDFPEESFDAITTITVLQHITDAELLAKSIGKMVNVLKSGGYIYTLEIAPVSLSQSMIDVEYIRWHTRQEWIQIFQNAGARLCFETMYPSFGISFLMITGKIAKGLYHIVSKRIPRQNTQPLAKAHDVVPRDVKARLSKINNLVERIILSISKPLDYYVPFPERFGTTRIMVFKKELI